MLSSGFFFFKQKTAYEMRISDWSSDVCSSDLHEQEGFAAIEEMAAAPARQRAVEPVARQPLGDDAAVDGNHIAGCADDVATRRRDEIGRASCRERVCQYV